MHTVFLIILLIDLQHWTWQILGLFWNNQLSVLLLLSSSRTRISSKTYKANMDLDSNLKNLQQDQHRPKYKIGFIIYVLITVFSLTSAYTLRKSHLKNPYTAIQVAWSKTSDHQLCFHSLSSLYKNRSSPSKTITPSGILTLSLQVGFNELNDEIMPTINHTLTSEAADPRTTRALKKCNNLLSDALRSINVSLSVIAADNDPDGRIFQDANFTRCMEGNLSDARAKIGGCRPGTEVLDVKLKEPWLYVDNSFRILYYEDEIHQELNPTISGYLELVRHYFHPQLMLGYSQYVFLVLLVILFVKIKGWEFGFCSIAYIMLYSLLQSTPWAPPVQYLHFFPRTINVLFSQNYTVTYFH